MTLQLNKTNKLSKFPKNRKLSNKLIIRNTLFGGASINPYARVVTPPPARGVETPPPYYAINNVNVTDAQEEFGRRLIQDARNRLTIKEDYLKSLKAEIEFKDHILKNIKENILSEEVTLSRLKENIVLLRKENNLHKEQRNSQPPNNAVDTKTRAEIIENLSKIDKNIRIEVLTYLKKLLSRRKPDEKNRYHYININMLKQFMTKYNDIRITHTFPKDTDTLQKALATYGRQILLKILKKEKLTEVELSKLDVDNLSIFNQFVAKLDNTIILNVINKLTLMLATPAQYTNKRADIVFNKRIFINFITQLYTIISEADQEILNTILQKYGITNLIDILSVVL